MSRFSFNGTIITDSEGENNGGEGTLIIDGVRHSVKFSASHSHSEYIVDGSVLPHTDLKERLDDYFAENWIDWEDSRWIDNPDRSKSMKISF